MARHATTDRPRAGVGLAREKRFRAVAVRVDQVRGNQCKPEGMQHLWQALLRGRWSMAASFDQSGRYYVVLSSTTGTIRALTPRERTIVSLAAVGCSDEDIGHRCGIAPPTVRTYLSRAMRKLEIPGRLGLLVVAGTMLGGRPT